VAPEPRNRSIGRLLELQLKALGAIQERLGEIEIRLARIEAESDLAPSSVVLEAEREAAAIRERTGAIVEAERYGGENGAL
jgi:hypothetical protein